MHGPFHGHRLCHSHPTFGTTALRSHKRRKPPRSAKMKNLLKRFVEGIFGLGEAEEDHAPPEFHTMEDVRKYIQALNSRYSKERRSIRVWQMVERITLAMALAATFFNYYWMTVIEEILSMTTLRVNVIVPAAKTSCIFLIAVLAA